MNKLLFLCLAAVTVSASVRFPKLKKSPSLHKPSLQESGEPLILTPYLEANKIEEARKASQVDAKIFHNITSYSGYLTVDKENNGNLFFWFFPSANSYEEDPVLVWLQGGPGGTSMYGLFVEHGPFGVENSKVVLRDFSWHKNHSVLYIDNPVGSGFSFVENEAYVTNQTQVANHLYTFLMQFFTMFPEIQNNGFFISGESYAGKYVPAIGYAIHKNNPTAPKKINLQGLLIGNGLSDPKHQSEYSKLLYQLGIIDKNAADIYKNYESLLIKSIELDRYNVATNFMKELTGNLWNQYTALPNIYNFASDGDDSPTEWQDFIETAEIRKAIHAGNQTFSSENDVVYYSLYNDISQSVAPWVSELLSHYKIIAFNGQLDIIVAYSLTANYLQNLNFSASADYANAERKVWMVDNKVAGYKKNAGNLTEVLVRGAGHMVPKDQPKATYDMVYKFIRGEF